MRKVRKKKSSQIENPVPKPSPEDLKTWNGILAGLWLSSERGRDPRMVYVGSSTEVAFIEGAEGARREFGRTAIRDEATDK